MALGLGRPRFGVIAALALAPCVVHAEDTLHQRALDLFERSCLGLERPELNESATGPWIEELCEREAAIEAEAFDAAGPEERHRMLAAECDAWYQRNLWRLPPRLQVDTEARAGYLTEVCGMEADERLRDLAE